MSALNWRFWGWSVSRVTKLGNFLFMFLVGPFLDKRLLAHDPPISTGSMHRWAVWLFTLAMCYRLVTLELALGWADAFTVFVIVFALALNYQLLQATPDKTIAAVTAMFGAARDSVSAPAVPPAPAAAPEGQLADESDEPA